MDRNNILALILISVLLFGYMIFNSMMYEQPIVEDSSPSPEQSTESFEDQSDERKIENKSFSKSKEINEKRQDFLGEDKDYGKILSPYTVGEKRLITIETDLIIAKISAKGGSIVHWELKNFKKWDGVPTQLVKERKGQLYLTFISSEGKKIDTRDLFFQLDTDKDYIKLSGEDEFTFNSKLTIEGGHEIIKSYKFFANKYSIETDVELVDMGKIIPRGYSYNWSGGLAYQEKNSVDESGSSYGILQMNGEVEELLADEGQKVNTKMTGVVDYIGTKTKYFAMAIMPEDFDGTANMTGYQKTYPKTEGLVRSYDISLEVPYYGGKEKTKYKVFIGPLDLDIVGDYGLNRMLDLGWWGIRHIAEYVMMPFFKAVHYFIPNWGITIIVFSILIKIVLYPLSRTQMKNASKMKLLAPEISAMRDKFKDDPQKQQKEMMKIYSQYGVNPAGGCFPMLLQMPILYSLWVLFRGHIDLRQSEFILWIDDLSTPDTILFLGNSVPLISSLSGLALLMGVTMFIQQKLTISDPRQKGLIYMMPVMFVLLFSSFPSGLNLYYFMFNLIGIGQQVYINKFSKSRVTSLSDLKRDPNKKQSWLQRKMEEAQAIAEAQGKSVPGKSGSSKGTAKNPADPNYRKKKKKK